MTISRGQMKRQLRMGGGIMDVVPREPEFRELLERLMNIWWYG